MQNKISLIIVLIILLLPVTNLAQQEDGSVFERKVTLNQKNQPLGYILDQLSWQAGVFFSYDATIIEANKKYSLEISSKSLFTVLNQLFDSDKFNFSERENQIIISKKIINEQIEPPGNDSIPVKYFFLNGKVLDSKKENPLKYATISLLNKPIGTITNTDGDFLLKIHPDNILDTAVISCMGFKQIFTPAYNLLDEDVFMMDPISIRIKEVKVTAITPSQLLSKIRENFSNNYSNYPKLMTAFYRETLRQEGSYINVSEAVMNILKASYSNYLKTDVVRLIKGRKSPDVKPFRWINFKLQGGPFTITQLDVIKDLKRFIDEETENFYLYRISKSIWYNDIPVYVLNFEPASGLKFPAFRGEMYVHRETFAVVYTKYSLVKNSLREAQDIMIKKKPRGVKASPSFVQYTVNYQRYQGVWQLATAQASVKFKIRSKKDKLNSEFHSISDLLITDIHQTDLKRFARDESVRRRDIFVEMIDDYDEKFWENYNIIQPDEDLRNAFKNNIGQ